MLLRHGIQCVLGEWACDQDLVTAIIAAAAGNTFISVHARTLLATTASQAALRLTPRELEVLSVLAQGEPNRAIARALGLKAKTVEMHLTHIFEKLGVGSRTEAALFAQELGPFR